MRGRSHTDRTNKCLRRFGLKREILAKKEILLRRSHPPSHHGPITNLYVCNEEAGGGDESRHRQTPFRHKARRGGRLREVHKRRVRRIDENSPSAIRPAARSMSWDKARSPEEDGTLFRRAASARTAPAPGLRFRNSIPLEAQSNSMAMTRRTLTMIPAAFRAAMVPMLT